MQRIVKDYFHRIRRILRRYDAIKPVDLRGVITVPVMRLPEIERWQEERAEDLALLRYFEEGYNDPAGFAYLTVKELGWVIPSLRAVAFRSAEARSIYDAFCAISNDGPYWVNITKWHDGNVNFFQRNKLGRLDYKVGPIQFVFRGKREWRAFEAYLESRFRERALEQPDAPDPAIAPAIPTSGQVWRMADGQGTSVTIQGSFFNETGGHVVYAGPHGYLFACPLWQWHRVAYPENDCYTCPWPAMHCAE